MPTWRDDVASSAWRDNQTLQWAIPCNLWIDSAYLQYPLVNNVHVTVFLVSLKAGGVALNLTEASRVYLMDSWWNPAVEFRTSLKDTHSIQHISCSNWLIFLCSQYAEAMDRIHRLGQHRPVEAIKLVIEDSIESRIVQVRHGFSFTSSFVNAQRLTII